MSAYLVAGLVLGGIYGIAAVGLTLTYVSSRVFNFAHGAIAFFVATCYYHLIQGAGVSPLVAGAVSVFVIAPALGLVLWALIFRLMPGVGIIIQVVATIGLYVAIPSLTTFAFGNEPVFRVPGLFGDPPGTYHVGGVALNSNQIAVLVCAAAVAVLLTVALRYTETGLIVRAVVNSPALSELHGTNANVVAAGAWMVGTLFAGLAGVLVAPILGLDSSSLVLLVLASFAAVIVGQLRSLSWTFAGAVGLGVLQQLSVRYLPQHGVLSQGLRPSLPFLVMFVALLAYNVRGRGDADKTSDATWSPLGRPSLGSSSKRLTPRLLVLVAALLAVPAVVPSYWVGLAAEGVVFGIVFLSISVITGEAGIVSLCQVSFVGVGGLVTAQLSTVYHLPFVLAVGGGAVAAAALSLVIAIPTLRLGPLFVALSTIAFAVLVDQLLFRLPRFFNSGIGVTVGRPNVFGLTARSDRALYYATLLIFGLVAWLVRNLRHSSAGQCLAAVRSSESASAMIRLSPIRVKLLAFALSAAVAGIGGGLLASINGRSLPTETDVLAGLVWFAVVVVWGMRTNVGPLLAGLSVAVLPQLLSQHVSGSLANLLPAFFGLGAIRLAREPAGIVGGRRVIRSRSKSRQPGEPERLVLPVAMASDG